MPGTCLALLALAMGRTLHGAALAVLSVVAAACGKGDAERGSSEPEAGVDSASMPSMDGGDDGLTPITGDGAPGACGRSVTLAVGATDGGAPEPFDVIVVADNADGITFSNADLANGLKNLLAHVAGQSVRFFLLSTTQYGASSKAATDQLTGKNLVSWSSSVTGAADANPVSEYSQTCLDTTGKSIPCPTQWIGTQMYSTHGQWTFTLPPPVAAITPGMTSAQIAAQQQALSSAVLALGGGGSEEEQPICTLARYITQKGFAFPQRAVFLVISDEDDTNPPLDCLTAYDFSMKQIASGARQPCTSGCAGYTYQVTRPTTTATENYTCVPKDDQGNLYPSLGKARSLGLGGTFTCGACNADETTLASNDCGVGYVVQGCAVTCGAGSNSCSVDLPTNAVDACTQAFQENGTNYASLVDYCTKVDFAGPGTADAGAWGNCTVQGYSPSDAGASFSDTDQKTPVFDVGSSAEMVSSFKNAASVVFGATGFKVETIQLDPAFSCPMGPGQSYAPTLRTLATSSADVFSLCGSYAGALAQVQSFAAGVVGDYALALGPSDAISTVTVTTSSGAVRTVPAGDYSYAGGVLTFASGTLTPGDATIQVTIAGQACRADASGTTR